MFHDALLSLSSAQTVTGSAAVTSTNTIDVGSVRDLVGTDPPIVEVSVNTSFAGLTSLEVQAIACSDPSLMSNLAVVGSSGPIPVASLTAGARFAVALSARNALAGQRYLGLRYVITGVGTAGVVSASLAPQIQDGGQKIVTPTFTII
jgi:hypothetical protein